MSEFGVDTERNIALPTMALPSYVSGQKRKKFLLLVGLLLALILAVFLLTRFYSTKEDPLPAVGTVKKDQIIPPGFVSVITGGQGNLTLYSPLSLAIHPNGNVYINSGVRNKAGLIRGRVEVCKPDGTFLFAFDKIDGGKTLRSPIYIAINKKGDVYVSDKLNRAIYVFSSDGKFKKKFAPNNDPNFMWMPIALAFDQDDNLYVTDISTQHQVFVFTPYGALKTKFGSTGYTEYKNKLPGKFSFPNGIFIDRDKRVFVADSNNRRVQVFTPEGKFLYMVNTGGLPRGICVDDKNRLYVVDALGHDVSVFKKTDKSGTALTVFGGQGVGFGQFLYPNGMALDSSGKIYVADRENHRIQVWAWPIVAAAVSKQVQKALPIASIVLPLMILMFYLLMRRRRYYVSETFLNKIINNRQLANLAKVSGKFFVHPKVYERFKGYKENGLEVQDFVRPAKVDELSFKNMISVHHLSDEAAVLFAAAGKGLVKPRVLTEDAQSHAVAAQLNMETMDHELFKEFFDIA
jgi:DNA-binding beta-propeller fold protein YncE